MDDETIIAALLHDIGWLVPKPADSSLLTTSDESVRSTNGHARLTAMLDNPPPRPFC